MSSGTTTNRADGHGRSESEGEGDAGTLRLVAEQIRHVSHLERRWSGMPEALLADVRAGLRKGTRLIGILFAAATVVYFAAYFWFSVVAPVFPVWWSFVYLAGAGSMTAVTVWYQASRVNPRIVAFVERLSNRLGGATYIPYGTRLRGLMLAFDNGLIMNPMQNSLTFQLFLAADGTVVKPTASEVPPLLRSFRGARRRGTASTRKGDARMKAELDRVCGLLGSRSGWLILFEKPAHGGSGGSTGRWQSVCLFSVPKWVQRPDAIGAAVDDIERLLEQAPTGLALS